MAQYHNKAIHYSNCLRQKPDDTKPARAVLITAEPGARFSKALETFRARKAVFSSSVSKNGDVSSPETFCMKGSSVHIKNM